MIFKRYSSASLFISVLGLIATFIIATIINYSRSSMYNDLLFTVSLNGLVKSVEKGRGVAFVIFEDGTQYEIPWAKNLQYEEFPSLSVLISAGDFISKKAFSDTLKVRHSSKEYIYVLNQTIGY